MSDEPASEKLDLTFGMEFDLDPSDINALTNDLNQADAFDAEEADSETLAEYACALKELSDAIDDARKGVFEAELDARVELDEEVGPLVKRQGSRRYVSDRQEVIDVLEDHDADPKEAMKFKASDLADLLTSLGVKSDEYIDRNEYEYFRRR